MPYETEIIVSRGNKMNNRALSWLSSCFTEKCENVWILQRLKNMICKDLREKIF